MMLKVAYLLTTCLLDKLQVLEDAIRCELQGFTTLCYCGKVISGVTIVLFGRLCLVSYFGYDRSRSCSVFTLERDGVLVENKLT
jgi:hypothetical protein